MSDLNNQPPIQENFVTHEETNISPWTTLITMVLLISGFLLAGTIFFHYGTSKIGEDGKVKDHLFNLTTLKETGKSLTEKQQVAEKLPSEEPEEEAKAKESPVSKLFTNHRDKVRWPKLELTGFGSGTAGDGDFAIINGKQVHVGQLIDDKVRLKTIRSHDIIVEYMGETKTLTVD